MRFQSRQECEKFIRDRSNNASMTRMALAHKSSEEIAYYQGVQWLGRGLSNVPFNSTTGRIMPLSVNYNPDTSKLRMTMNKTTRFVLASASATFPQSIEAQVEPPERDGGIEASVAAQVLEDAIQAGIKDTRLLTALRYTNHMRCITGTYGIGLSMRIAPRMVQMDGAQIPAMDRVMEAFSFHPYRLILDPGCTSIDLRDHDEVIYDDVWTINKLRRLYPTIAFDEDEMDTVGSLAFNEIQVSQIPGVNLFQQYAQYSSTKGARVFQVHCKDERGRFSYMYACVEMAKNKEIIVVNEDEPYSPFGGDGLPLGLIHGHLRPDSPWSIGDVAMMRDSQDKLNLTETWNHRIAQKYSGWQWIVDMNWFGRNVSEEDGRHRFHNAVAGVIMGKPNSNDKHVNPPQLVTTPPPQQFIGEMAQAYTANMREDAFRSEQSMGLGIKTHTPDKAYERLLYEGDRIHGQRVQRDITTYQQLIEVMLGTLVKNTQAGSPSTLAMLRREEFEEQDIGVLLETDPEHPAKVTIAESSIRYRSVAERKNALDTAAQNQQITPDQYQQGLAKLDMALTDEHRYMKTEIAKAVALVIRGMEWEPKPLGQYTEWLLTDLRMALWDRRAKFDPETQARIKRAIESQTMYAMQIQAMQAMAENPPQAQPGQQAAPPPQTVGEALAALTGSV